MPVVYSPLIKSTPSTPNATTAKVVPCRLVATGLKAALSVGRSDDLEHARRLIAAGTEVTGRTGMLSDPSADLTAV